mgnify:CR=1 FL=1
MKSKKRKTTALLGAATAVCVAVSSLAVFTDRFQSQAEYTAGSLDLELTETWQADNAALDGAYKPGTGLKLDYTLSNDGNLAALVRENFIISSDKAVSAGDQREFDLYQADDVTLDANGNVLNISGDPLVPAYGNYSDDSGDHYTLSYSLDELVLNGTGSNAETVSGGLNGYDGEYVLVFNSVAGNDFQKSSLDIEYLAQALQHGGTGSDTWADAKVISEQITLGGQNINVVPTLEQQGGAR